LPEFIRKLVSPATVTGPVWVRSPPAVMLNVPEKPDVPKLNPSFAVTAALLPLVTERLATSVR
jgi:hypothetical protein